MKRYSLVVSFLVFLVFAVCVKAYAGGCYATEPTQILNYVELMLQYGKQAEMVVNQATQIQNQLNQYANMLQNSTGITSQIWTHVVPELSQLQQVVGQGQALSYTMGNMSGVFAQRFPGFQSFLTRQMGRNDFQSLYGQWSQQTRDTCQGALAAANLHYQDFATEQGTLTQLESANWTANSRLQAIQIGNELAGQMVDQMQKLRQLMMTQINLQGQYMAQKQDITDVDRANLQNYFNPPTLQMGSGQGYGPNDIH